MPHSILQGLIRMSMFLCPLCGRQVSLARFDPSGFEDDVIAIEKVSLGRGRGFEEIDRYSLLEYDEPALELLKERVLEIHGFLFHEEDNEAEELERARVREADPQLEEDQSHRSRQRKEERPKQKP